MEQELPASLTARAAKAALPGRATLTRDARASLNSAASVFALYLSAAAQEAAAAGKRQTVALRDVLQALRDVDFEHLVAPVELCVQEAKAKAARKKSRVEEEEEAEEEDEMMESVEEPTEEEDEQEGEFKESEPPADDEEREEAMQTDA